MKKKKVINAILIVTIVLSFTIKLVLILKYKNLLTLSSDDLNYIKSAVVLVKKGVLTFHNYNEPTVFVMPLYPMFLATIFKVFGYGLLGLQFVRIVQAVLSCITIVLIYLLGKQLFSPAVGIISSILVAFYIPNITTTGYVMTETLFTTLLVLLIYISIIYSRSPSISRFCVLGIVWAATTLIRPTIALYPVLLFVYILIHHRMSIKEMTKLGIAMFTVFCIIMSPWWIRNYREYKEFIPLSAASGNPMLQGTYVDYKQTPQNIVYYKLGKTAFETNKTEVEIAKRRIIDEFKKDFWGYLRWFTIGKTYLFWNGIFYWKEFLGVNQQFVLTYHKVLLLGFIGVFVLLFKNFSKYMLPLSVVVYFNAVHCIYMAFDRYAFPLMPIVTVFFAYLVVVLYEITVKSLKYLSHKVH